MREKICEACHKSFLLAVLAMLSLAIVMTTIYGFTPTGLFWAYIVVVMFAELDEVAG